MTLSVVRFFLLLILQLGFISSTTLSFSTCDDKDNEGEICSDGNNTQSIGRCLQRSVDDGGSGAIISDAVKASYDDAVEAGIKAGGGTEMVINGLNSIKAGATIPNPEGIAMCTEENSFYWVPNCNLFNFFCINLTPEETLLGGVGYVVDTSIHSDAGGFHRYAFNDTYALKTEYQSPTLPPAGYKCRDLGWYKTNTCLDPLAATCPEMGREGLGLVQYYGSPSQKGVVVGVIIRENKILPCLSYNSDDEDDNNDEAAKKAGKKKNSKKGGSKKSAKKNSRNGKK